MLLTEQIPNISAKVNLLAKVVWPTLATLVPAAIVGAVKWVQDHTSKRRSAELTERISTLAKRISELPVLSLSSATPAATPQSALTAELESALRELTSLQKTRAIRRFTGLTTTTAKVRAALLLYRPVGIAAWTLHLAFYVYLFCLVFALMAVFRISQRHLSPASPTCLHSSSSLVHSEFRRWSFAISRPGFIARSVPKRRQPSARRWVIPRKRLFRQPGRVSELHLACPDFQPHATAAAYGFGGSLGGSVR